MPPRNTPLLSVYGRPSVALVAAITAVTCASSGAVAVGAASEQPFAQVFSLADAQPAGSRHDIEAKKAQSTRALGRHLAEQPASRPTRYDDLAANKAQSMLALGLHLAEQRTSRSSR